MPTGNTELLYKNPNLSLKEFALSCASNFFRDVSSLPTTFKSSGYHEKQLVEAKAYLAEMRMAKPIYVEEMFADYLKCREADRKKVAVETIKSRRVFDRMKALVRAWRPPTPRHAALKRYMKEQLATETFYSNDELTKMYAPGYATAAEYKAARIQSLKSDVKYHTKKLREEAKRLAKDQAWVDALRTCFKE